MKKSKLFRMVYGLGIALIVSLIAALGGQNAHAQEIPNGDGDLLWERSIYPRFVNDAKFHPINGNIIAAVDYEIWEIDPKDGHTIRVFEGGYPADATDLIRTINITSDGQKIVTGGAMGQKGILIWDYNTGIVTKIIIFDKIFDVYENIGIYPDNNRIIFNTYQNDYGSLSNKIYINIYNLQLDSIVNQTSMADTYCDRFILSKDGKYIAYCIGKGNPKDGWYNTMELWDAETLTKIKDFGSPGDIHEFRDVQISDDNQYVGFRGDNLLFLFSITGKELKIPLQKYVYSFAFTPNCKFITLDIETIDNQENVYIYELSNLNKSYMYTNIFPRIMRYSTNNDFFISKMRLYSNHWNEVGITNPQEQTIQIKNTTYTNNSLQIITEGIEIINTLMITDTLGKKIYIQNEIPLLNNQTTIPLFLPSGNYLLKIISNGKEYTSKFIVER